MEANKEETKEGKKLIVKNCARCNKEITGTARKKFCSVRCTQNYYYHHSDKVRERNIRQSRESYQRNKDKPEVKLRTRERFKKWLSIPENKIKFNEKMRNYMRKRNYRLYHERLDAGLCTNCGRSKERDITTCNKCTEQRNKCK